MDTQTPFWRYRWLRRLEPTPATNSWRLLTDFKGTTRRTKCLGVFTSNSNTLLFKLINFPQVSIAIANLRRNEKFTSLFCPVSSVQSVKLKNWGFSWHCPFKQNVFDNFCNFDLANFSNFSNFSKIGCPRSRWLRRHPHFKLFDPTSPRKQSISRNRVWMFIWGLDRIF